MTKAPSQVFEDDTLRVQVQDILLLHEVTKKTRESAKYKQIESSVNEIGIIEPPVIVRDKNDKGRFHLLDGHLRLDILRRQGAVEVVCLVATEDEAYTYNKQISRLATVQEHKMILRAVEKGVSEKRLARALNINISSIRRKRNLLVGISDEVADLLKDKRLAVESFRMLKRLKPERQLAAARLMVAMNQYTIAYVGSLVAASAPDQLVRPPKRKKATISENQRALMEEESARLDSEIGKIEKSYGSDHLDLVLAIGYVSRLLENAAVVRYLAKKDPDILAEFQKITESQPEVFEG